MTPSDFLLVTRLMLCSPNLISSLSSRLASRYLEPIIINSVLLLFNVSLLPESHLSTLTRSVLSFASISREVSPSHERFVSSANNIGLLVFRQSGKSFMYKRNSIGPRLLPCGTPHFISLSRDIVPLTEQACFLCLRYDLNQSRLFPS